MSQTSEPAALKLHEHVDLPEAIRGTVMTYAADGKLLEKQLKRIDHRSFQFYSDEPARVGGEDTYPSPLGYFVGAATVCLITQVKLYAAMTKVEIADASCHAEFDFYREGSVLAGTVKGHPKSFRSHLSIASRADIEDVKRVIRLAKRGCFIEQLIQRAIPLESSYAINGERVEITYDD